MSLNNSLILLASFNGEIFLRDALDSFSNECDVLISDDGSTDNTIQIIKEYKRLNISLLLEGPFGGAAENFSYLLNKCSHTYDYYFLADQDDLWVDSKYLSLKSKMIQLELRYGTSTPILIFGDSTVVDSNLNIINNSFFNYESLSIKIMNNLKNIYFQNIGQGATIVFNQALITQIGKVPKGIIMHDWWLMIFAQSFGIAEFCSFPHLLYRQHENNVIGAKNRNVLQQTYNVVFSGSRKPQKMIDNIVKQATLFSETYDSKLDEKTNTFLDFIINRNSKSLFSRKFFLISNRIYLSNLKRTLSLYSFF